MYDLDQHYKHSETIKLNQKTILYFLYLYTSILKPFIKKKKIRF